MAKIIDSDFKKGTGGWTMQDGSAANWVESGGNPGGYFAWTDSNGDDSYYNAPKAFTGHMSAYFGGTLQYDIFDSGSNYSGVPDVELIANDGTTLVATVGQPGTDWTHLSVELDLAGGWHVGELNGDLATKQEIKAVLHHLQSLWIRAEYVFGSENGGIDNVILSPAAAQASTQSHLDAHLVPHDFGSAIAHYDHGHLAIA